MRENYVDIHSHILPGVDDGAPDMDVSMKMLDMAYKEGIRHLFFTPHYIRGENQYRPGDLKKVFSELQKRAKPEFPELQIYLGNEIYYMPGVVEDIRNGLIYTMADSRYVLVEFSEDISYRELYQAMKELVQIRVWPIIAHVERYHCLFRQMERLIELREMDIHFQLNVNGITGSAFNPDTKWKRRMIKEGVAGFLGTDAHDLTYRAPLIREAASWIMQKTSDAYSEKILWSNGHAVIQNKYI